ncbi:hypothetical protein RN001_015762 [Aquatica leii]|uniref:Cytochrome P450 n=1 Tax=Aquatica leii TaxID=1421715 RepID=A0AAN7QAT9_9COLE|nr:hypothetical protein RN001_015762 [Aquatica leii]
MLLILFLLLIISPFAFSFAKWYRRYRRRKVFIDKIPGPPSMPILGHTLKLFRSAEHSWNYFQLQNRTFYPLYKLWNAFVPLVGLISPDDIEVLLSSKKHMEKSKVYNWMQGWLGTGLLTSKGSKWHYRRKLLTPAFHFGILQQFSKTIIEQSDLLVERLGDECDKSFTVLDPIVADFTLHTICETAMGTKLDKTDKSVTEYIQAIYDIGQVLIHRVGRPWLFFEFFYKFTTLRKLEMKLIKILHTFSRSVIENRQQFFNETITRPNNTSKAKERMALLDLLISVKNNGAIIDDEGIREEVDTFMFEGHDTTASGILFALLLLSNHSDVQEKICREIKEVMGYSKRQFTFSDLQNMQYLEMVIKECLRLFPSVPLIARTTESDLMTASGYVIPADTIVHVHIYGLHHHPLIYPDPEKFDPERFSPENSKGRHPFAYIPFSAGPRNCIGQRFAMLELKSAVAAIIRNFILLPVESPNDVPFILHFVLKSTRTTNVKLRRRT